MADQALQRGPLCQLADDPEAAALAYINQHLAPLSTNAPRIAARTALVEFAARIEPRLDVVDLLCTQALMRTHDAIEGLNAFTQKRPLRWKNS